MPVRYQVISHAISEPPLLLIRTSVWASLIPLLAMPLQASFLRIRVCPSREAAPACPRQTAPAAAAGYAPSSAAYVRRG